MNNSAFNSAPLITADKRASGYIVPAFILIGFAFYFAYDIYTLKKCLTNVDIYTWYYPYRQWFSQRLLNGEFPLWNPYTGIGLPAALCATIPLDIYSALEIVFGPQYHYFQTAQLIALLLAGLYVFIKLGFPPIVGTAGVLLFFMTPWVTYFYFYFLLVNSYIAHILLFLFIFQWFKTEDKKYIFYTFWTTVFSMFGTKPEFWFCQMSFFSFFALTACLVFRSDRPARSFKMMLLVILSMLIGVSAHAWQLNILTKILGNAGRLNEHGLSRLLSPEMYYNLASSIADSSLIKISFLSCLLYFALKARKPLSRLVLSLIAVSAFLGLKIWGLPEISSIMNSSVLAGAILGLLFSLLFDQDRDWKEYIKTSLLFILPAYYWCRPGPGSLGEMDIIRSAPAAFMILLSTLVWLGCRRFTKSKLVQLSYVSILFILIMRDEGQIILAYVTGILWIPTRDNYIIDFAVSVIAISGLGALYTPDIPANKSKWIISRLAPVICIALIILSTVPNPYYVHSLMKDSPPGYPYFEGVPKLKKLVKDLKVPSGTRIFYVNYDAWGFSYGFGDSLLEGVGQVNIFDSLIPRRYREWTTFQSTGIRPEDNLSGYPGGYDEKIISRLPKMNNMGLNNWEIYRYTVIAQPPIKKDALKLLGVKYLVKMSPISGELAFAADDEEIENSIKNLNVTDVREIKGVAWPGVKEALYSARLSDPLPRAYLLYGVTDEKVHEFTNEMVPTVSDQNDFITTASYKFSLGPADINQYKPESVSISVDAKQEAYLVLSDLYYPYWHARIDGKEAGIIPAFHIFRSVKVPPGKHYVEFYYKVPYFKEAIIFSLIILALSIFTSLLFYKSRCGISNNPGSKQV